MITKKLPLLLFILCFNIFGQSNPKMETKYHKTSLKKVLQDIEIKYNVKFDYDKDIIKWNLINLPAKKRPLKELLSEITKQTDLKFTQLDGFHFYISRLEIILFDNKLVNKFLNKGIHKNKDGSFKINLKKLEILPGLIEPDAMESLQKLPSVLSINETATELNVKGGRTDQNNIIFDDINVYLYGHLFGMISAINPYVVDKIYFYDNGTNARYGEKISSVINMQTAYKIPKTTEVQMGINAINYDFLIKTPVVKNKIGLQVSYRHSFEGLFETPTFKNYEDKAFQNTTVTDEKFNFNDYTATLNYKINKKNELHATLLHIDNDLENKRFDPLKSYFDILDMENNGYNLQWNKKWNEHLYQKTSAGLSKYTLFYNLKTFNNNAIQYIYQKNNNINDQNIYTDFKWHLKHSGIINFGYQFKKQQVTYKITNTKGIIYILGDDDSTIKTHSLYTNFTKSKALNYFVYLGNRINYYTELNTTKFEPRFVINKNLNRYFKIQLSGEIKDQIISKIDETLLSNYSIENKLWRLSNKTNSPIINAKQIASNFILSKHNWTLDASIYLKNISGISSISLGYLNPNDTNFHIGEEKIQGANMFISRKIKNFTTWISYSYNKIQAKFDGILNNNYFTGSEEIKHNLTAALVYKHNNLQMALNWNFRTGKPKTDLDYDNNNNPYFDSINTENLPNFHRLDFSSTYKFKFSKKGKTSGKIGLSIRNVYNNKNLISVNYTGNNSLNDPIKVKKYYAIGFTPNFMFRVMF